MRCLLWTASVSATVAAPAEPGGSAIEVQGELGVGSSPFRMGGRLPAYARDALTFADFDGDGEEELLATLTPGGYPHPRHVAVLQESDGWQVKWKSELPAWADRMLVGDVDDDPLPEIVLFGEDPIDESQMQVIQWDGEQVAVKEFAVVGRLGLLADLDGDGKDELVLVRTRVYKYDTTVEDPANLLAYEYRAGRFALTHKRELATGVAALTSADLDGDGRREVVTSETSFDGEVSGRLSAYRFEPEGVVSVAFRRNGVLERVIFFRAFRSGGADYFFADRGSYQSVFRIWEDSGTFRMAPIDAGAAALPVYEDARLATAAYSEERDTFFQFAEEDRTRLVHVGRLGPQRRSPQ